MMDTDRNGRENELLAALVERLRGNPQFMASVLSTYQQRTGLDDEALARELGTSPEMIVRLALCKRPEDTSAAYELELRELSDYTMADEKVLSQVIRRCGSLGGTSIPAASAPARLSRPSRRWVSSAEWLGSTFTRPALTFACSFALLLTLAGGVLLWRQSLNVAPAFVALGPGIDPPPADSPNASLPDANSDASGPGGTHNSSAERSRGRGIASSQQLSSKIINLDGRSTLRDGGESGAPGQKIIRLPLSRTTLLIRLAEGSRPGSYTVSIVDAFAKTVFSTQKSSSRRGILRAVVDTRGIPPGEYRLCVRRESKEQEVPDYVRVLIPPSRSDSYKPR